MSERAARVAEATHAEQAHLAHERHLWGRRWARRGERVHARQDRISRTSAVVSVCMQGRIASRARSATWECGQNATRAAAVRGREPSAAESTPLIASSSSALASSAAMRSMSST